MTILALDYGERRIGVAISDETHTLARGLTTIVRRNRRTDTGTIRELVERHGVERIVIGYPRHLDGREGSQCQRVRRFAALLERVLGKPVVLWDETLSSREAQELMKDRGRKDRRQAGVVDRVAASLILQGYLDGQR
ncbi:MAG: Holliday junction resolvase RuvX [Syntrophales bacterium]|nr:Holliday junction resolvase RuvX [Syntrophales bacterium]